MCCSICRPACVSRTWCNCSRARVPIGSTNRTLPGKFGWQRGYGVFSVSQSGVEEVCAYIAGQEEHHKTTDFNAELRKLVERYGLTWREEENR